MKILAPTADNVAEAARAILGGGIVAYPTETVYGLGVDPFSEGAVAGLFRAKKRDRGKPVLLIVAGFDQLEGVAGPVSDRAAAYAHRFWPGPLSLLLPKSDALPEILTAGSDKVCVRCPGGDCARDLCRAVGHAVTSSSANFSGDSPARSLDEVNLAGVMFGLDGGVLPASAPSTVFDPESGRILREGVISEAELRAVE